MPRCTDLANLSARAKDRPAIFQRESTANNDGITTFSPCLRNRRSIPPALWPKNRPLDKPKLGLLDAFTRDIQKAKK